MNDFSYKIRRGAFVHRHYDHASRCARKKCRDPLCRVLSPKQNPVTLSDVLRFEFLRKCDGPVQDLAVGRPFRAISTALPVSALALVRLKVHREIFRQGFGHGDCASRASSLAWSEFSRSYG